MSGVLPVDYLCETVADVVLRDVRRIGEDFDFANSAAPRFDDFFALLGAAGGGFAEVGPFDEWRTGPWTTPPRGRPVRWRGSPRSWTG